MVRMKLLINNDFTKLFNAYIIINSATNLYGLKKAVCFNCFFILMGKYENRY